MKHLPRQATILPARNPRLHLPPSRAQVAARVLAGSLCGLLCATLAPACSDSGAGTGSLAGFARYSVTFLGEGFAVDMNDSGTVVGQAGGAGRLWTNAGATVDLGALIPVAVNNGGVVVGNLPGADTTPALWENGAVRALGGLAGPFVKNGLATDINDRREVALFVLSITAYLWRNDSVTALSPFVLGGLHTLHSLGRMNRWGEVAASCPDYAGHATACVLSAGGGTSFGGNGEAVAVNDSGRAIGSIFFPDNPANSGGWLSGYGLLPILPVAINNSMQIIGQGYVMISGGMATTGGAFLWQYGDTASLSALVVDARWQVSGAVAINERGQIAAYGVNTATGARGVIRLDPVLAVMGTARSVSGPWSSRR